MKILPILNKFWPIFFILILWSIFSAPFFFKQKVPFPSNYQVNAFAPWDAYPQFAGPVKNAAIPDVITQIVPWKYFTIQTLKNGQIPFWNPYSFSGTPHLANYQSAVLSPFNLLFFVFSFKDAWAILVLLQPLLAAIFLYMYCRSVKISKAGGLIASVAFMFCGFITTWMSYATLGYAILFAPLGMFAIEKFYQKQNRWYLFLLVVTIPLSFFSGHFQISIYFFFVIFAYSLFKFIQNRKYSYLLLNLLSILFGFLLTLPQVFPSLEFYTQTLRSSNFLRGEVIPWRYVATLFAPDFFGNPVTRNDWFGHYAEWNGYIGLVPILLAFFSLKSKLRIQVIFFFFLGIGALLFTLPTPLIDFVVNLHIPVISTSAASRVIVVFSLSFAMLSGFGFDALEAHLKEKKLKSIFVWMTFCITIFLLLWMTVLLKIGLPLSKDSIAKQNIILPTLFLIIMLTFTIFYCITRRMKKNFSVSIIVVLLITLTSLDLLRFSTKWQPFDPKAYMFSTIQLEDGLKNIPNYQRVVGNLGAQAGDYYNLALLDGYDALYINRYGQFIASLSDGNFQNSYRSVVDFPKSGKYTQKAIDFLRVGFVIHKNADDNAVWTFPYWKYPSSQFSLVFKDNSYRIYKNSNVFPIGFITSSYKVYKDSQKILDTMFSDSFDLKKSIILEKYPDISSGQDQTGGKVSLVTYSPDSITLQTSQKNNGFLFIAEPFYPGWTAFVDGKQTPIERADFSFRAIYLHAGKHVVTFTYLPKSFLYGLLFALVGFVGSLLLVFLPKKKIL